MTVQEKAEAIENIRKQILHTLKSRTFSWYRVFGYVDLWNRFFCYVKITSELNDRRNESIEELVVVKSSKLDFYLFAIVTFALFSFAAYSQSELDLLWAIPVFILISWSIYYIASYSQAKKITISKEGIVCDESRTSWDEILQTFIGNFRSNTGFKSILFIALSNGEVLEYDISNFAFNDIGHMIEHYKRIHVNQTAEN